MTQQGLGVPVKLLHESLGHIITAELKTGQLYRGKLAEGATFNPIIKTKTLFLTSSLNRSRGQFEHLTQGYYRHRSRWARLTIRPGLH